MKKLLLLLFLITVYQGFSQTKGISYQAVILNPTAQELPGENAEGNILANTAVSIEFTVVNASGSEEFQEYHQTSTDSYGMINLLIGSGSPTSNNDFTDIVWDGNTKRLKIGIDFSGGTNFSPLSEQNLSYMPQPPTQETTDLILDITDLILAETARAEAAEQVNASNISENASAISVNIDEIASNTTDISINTNNIANNSTNIAANTSNINLKEDAANKSTTATLGTSDVLFPTQNAVKTYVDTEVTAINTLADGTIYLGDTNGDAQEVTMSGDVTIDNAGVATIGRSKVVSSMILDGTIVVGDLANDAVETAKIKDANVTTAKIADANV
ncbi:MAG: hypothetical protein ACI83H_000627, partial [Glaciecola sp.]